MFWRPFVGEIERLLHVYGMNPLNDGAWLTTWLTPRMPCAVGPIARPTDSSPVRRSATDVTAWIVAFGGTGEALGAAVGSIAVLYGAPPGIGFVLAVPRTPCRPE